MQKKLCRKVNPEFSGGRLDVYISSIFENKSRSHVQKLIKDEMVKVNGKVRKSSFILKENDVIDITVPEPHKLDIKAENIPLTILYEDKDLIVVDKPQGMVVHPACGNYTGTLVNALLNACSNLSGINGVIRPGIVHRIDKNTSGILVAAKNDNAHIKLAEQLNVHSMKRIYYALCEGVIKDDSGTVDTDIGRDLKDRKKMAVVERGKHAITHYYVIKRFKNNTLVKCRLETGRTHQIRVHLAHIGHPLVGDDVYGYKKQRFNLKGQMLHAAVLGFIHPSTGDYMEFFSPVPEYFERILCILKKELI